MTKKVKVTKIDMNQLRLHVPNEMHLQACIKGGSIYRDRTKYTRKEKHKMKALANYSE